MSFSLTAEFESASWATKELLGLWLATNLGELDNDQEIL